MAKTKTIKTALKAALGNAIAIVDGIVYYINAKDVIDSYLIPDRSKLIVDGGFTYEQLADQILDRHVLDVIEKYKRNKPNNMRVNLRMCQDTCNRYYGKTLEEFYKSYETQLSKLARTRDNKSARRVKPNKPKKVPAEAESQEEKVRRAMDRQTRMEQRFGYNLRTFSGITRTFREGFEVIFSIDTKVLKNHVDRFNWCKTNGRAMAAYAFDEIRREPTWRSRLIPGVRYLPGEVSVTPYGDVIMEFNVIKKKQEETA